MYVSGFVADLTIGEVYIGSPTSVVNVRQLEALPNPSQVFFFCSAMDTTSTRRLVVLISGSGSKSSTDPSPSRTEEFS